VNRSESLAERFMSHVAKGPSCWDWQASKMNSGYGQFGILGKMRQAHRVSYELHVGPIPDGMSILHSCDNKICVNPAHLRAGTRAENLKEAYERKRRAVPDLRGEKHPGAQITASDAMRMRDLRTTGMTVAAIAKRYGVKRSLVSDVVNKRTWRHE
jgi:hypothetical protein